MKKRGTVKMIMFCAVLVFLAAGIPAHAKEGFYIGLEIPYNKIEGDFDGKKAPIVDGGAGVGFIFGYGLTRGFSIELGWAGRGHKSVGSRIGFGEFSLNGKYAFDAAPNIQPFLFAGLGAFTLGDDSLTFGGSGYNLGLGLDLYSSAHVSWGIALIRKGITYDRVVKSNAPFTMTSDLNGDTTSLRFDVTYHF